MAHFGGFEEAFVDDKLQTNRLENTWEWSIGRMAEANTNLPLFADISYLSEVLVGNAKARRDALTCMTRFKDRFSGSDKLLMYGTDWSMIGHEPNFTVAYPELVANFLYQVGYRSQIQLENIFFRNAVRFLGLSASDRDKGTRGRLERFHQANASWMTVFD
jgi:hypothetical protein